MSNPLILRRRSLLLGAAAATLAMPHLARAQSPLRVGDQRGNARAVMEAAGVLKDLEGRIVWSEFPAAAPLVEALNADAIDTGLVGDAPFTFGAAAGVPIKAIAATRENRDGLAILVPKDSPVQSLQDLKGKRIATGRGSIGHQLVLAALENAKLPLDAVQMVFLLPADAKAAYSSGAVDAWSTWEPYVAQEEVTNGARRVANGAGITPGLGFQAARNDAIASRRPELADFVRRLATARAWANANPAGYARTWSALMNIPEPVAELWFRRAQTRVVPIDDGVVTDEQKNIDLYTRARLVRTTVKAADLLDPSFAEAIQAGNKTG
ncbi:aliphatic sulfonate ABC transporter substrate-binding protein [Pseudoroseomonas wenyumeiae]|uniref:Putative aliphatic sulfonates-binding protein n=1 Tax=Teichococcus wenyumeiae TaxID=2478470 RepID=A0A3A9JFG2_9PROT|nr:ABC transporter substrate-binding protein [Pseudoroseomonas wenyumeiae]RKK05010.1 ABC transporter substrate-binding protein [Pseudoroseomonas wenyumeiae]RMI20559.1 aliphatic sulfonate ABC transporter substrate-binding protein [Pseudoroseomonas wenyumeiae]